MRKAVTNTTWRAKERRKEDDLPPLQPSQQSYHHQQDPSRQTTQNRDRDYHTAPSLATDSTHSVTLPEQRKLSNGDEASLQTKNYRLAKELSEIRVRHREECKHVTRLTMENMNLASRCREAMSHVAIIKKELSLQKKKAAEAISMQKLLAEQLSAFQNREKMSAKNVAPAVAERSESVILENGNYDKRNNRENYGRDEPLARLRLVVDDPLNESKNESSTGKNKKSQPSVSPPSPAHLTDVAAELDRMDQILAEHKEKAGQLLGNESDSSSYENRGKEPRKQVSQLIVEAITNQHYLAQSVGDKKNSILVSVGLHDKSIEQNNDISASLPINGSSSERLATFNQAEPPSSNTHTAAETQSSKSSESVPSKASKDDIVASFNSTELNEHKTRVEEEVSTSATSESLPTEAFGNEKQIAYITTELDKHIAPVEDESLRLASSESLPIKASASEKLTSLTSSESSPRKVSTSDKLKPLDSLKGKIRSELEASILNPVTLVSSDDYEEVEEEALPESKRLTNEKDTAALIHAFRFKTIPEKENSESRRDDNVPASPIRNVLERSKFFPFSASPKVEFSSRGTDRHLHNYNEEFPEDITPTLRTFSLDRKLRIHTSDLSVSENGEFSNLSTSSPIPKSSTRNNKLTMKNNKIANQLMSSIDAFEASFNINFPDSFSPREASIAEEGEREIERGISKKVVNNDIYNPFSCSPVPEREEKQVLTPDEKFVKNTSLPLFLSPKIVEENVDAQADIEKQPLLSFKSRNGSYRDYMTESSKVDNVSSGNGIRDRAAAAYHRASSRRGKFFDPPGKDRTSARIMNQQKQPSPANRNNGNDDVTSNPSKPKDPPPVAIREVPTIENSSRADPQSSVFARTNGQHGSTLVLQQASLDDTSSRFLNPLQESNPTGNQAQHNMLEKVARAIPQVESPRISAQNVHRVSANETKKAYLPPETTAPHQGKSLDPPSSSLQGSTLTTTTESNKANHYKAKDPDKTINTETENHSTQQINSPRVKYALALASSSRVANNVDKPIFTGNDAAPSKRLQSSTMATDILSKYSKNSAESADTKDFRNRTLYGQKSTTFITPVDSTAFFFSPVLVHSTVDEGDIPMVSKLSPEKPPLEEPALFHNTVPTNSGDNNIVNLRDIASNIQRTGQGYDDTGISKSSSVQIRQWRADTSCTSQSCSDKLESPLTTADDDDDNDDIIEITKPTTANDYDYSAASRFILNATKKNDLRGSSETGGVTAHTASYRR